SEASISGERARKYVASTIAEANRPAGIANHNTRRRQPGRAGWSALRKLSRKAGTPIVSSEINEMWRGRNGNTEPENPIASTNITEYTVFEMYTHATRTI